VLTRDGEGNAVLGKGRVDAALASAGVSTPAYVYDLDGIVGEALELSQGFGGQRHLVAYAVKANSAGPILRALAAQSVGADVVSGAELELALRCGVEPGNIVYSGVAKSVPEIDRAIGAGIFALQVESVEEIPRIAARAQALGQRVSVSVRINPGIEADTHAYIATGHDEAKFGVPRASIGDAVEALRAAPLVDLVGVGHHIGSQLTSLDEYVSAARMLVPIFATCEAAMLQSGRPALKSIDFGGGFGIDYGAGCLVRPRDFAAAVASELARAGLTHLRATVEPGRSLVGSHGVLVASVIMQKRAGDRRWLMIDAGMNDLLRPALYQALHRIEPLSLTAEPTDSFRVVGPVCESSDDFGAHVLPVAAPAAVVIRDAGAYGYTMASEYNGRGLPTEVFLRDGAVVAVLRARSPADWVDARAALGS
jgi:diaminopimelate decarboxylase